MEAIHIFDIENGLFRKSKIKAPLHDWNYACLVSTHETADLLTNGYIRENFNGDNFMMDLIMIIAQYNYEQDLYCLDFSSDSGSGMWRMNVSEILADAELCI